MAAPPGNRDKAVMRETLEAMDFLANVLESSTEYAIIGKDLDGTILLWNEGARRLYSYEPEVVVGKASSESLLTPEDVAAGRPREIIGTRSTTRRVLDAQQPEEI